jgi:hypothetical protein
MNAHHPPKPQLAVRQALLRIRHELRRLFLAPDIEVQDLLAIAADLREFADIAASKAARHRVVGD